MRPSPRCCCTPSGANPSPVRAHMYPRSRARARCSLAAPVPAALLRCSTRASAPARAALPLGQRRRFFLPPAAARAWPGYCGPPLAMPPVPAYTAGPVAGLAGRRDRYSASPAMVRVAAAALSFRATARRRRCRSTCCLEPTKRPRPRAVPCRAPARLAGSAARCSIIAAAALPAPPPAGSPASAMLCFRRQGKG